LKKVSGTACRPQYPAKLPTTGSIMETLAFAFLPFACFGLVHSLDSRKLNLTETYRELRGQLDNRYKLIPEMNAVVKKYIPTEGALLEKIIKVRINAADKLGTESSHCVQHEIYEILVSLICLIEEGNGKGAKDILRLKRHMAEIEQNIKGSENFYQMTVKDYNRFLKLPLVAQLARLFRFEASEIFIVHKVEIEKTEVTSEELWGELQELASFA
jgi:hypothetical protein